MKLHRNPDAKLPIKCPHCEHQFKELVTRLESNPALSCPSCHGAFSVDRESIDRMLSEIDELATDFGNKISSLPKFNIKIKP